MPRVSVLMPAYNSEKYIHEAVSSILNQTYRDFELIIIDDFSIDKTAEIIREFNDERIKFFQNPSNLKTYITRNKCIELSSGEYIANLDSDDFAAPERLEKQVRFMEENPEIGVCGSYAKIIGDGTIRKFETDDSLIRFKMLFDSHFLNSSAIIRRSVLDQYHIRYNTEYELASDYALWIELGKHCRFANIPEALVNYRIHSSAITEKYYDLQQKNADLIRLGQIKNLGISINDHEKIIHLELVKMKYRPLQATSAASFHKWILKLIIANRNVKIYDKNIFEDFFIRTWTRYVNDFNFSNYNIVLWKTVVMSPFSGHYHLNSYQKFTFAIKCLIFRKSKSRFSGTEDKEISLHI